MRSFLRLSHIRGEHFKSAHNSKSGREHIPFFHAFQFCSEQGAIPLFVDRCAHLGKLSPQAPHNPCAVSKVAAEALWGWMPQSFRQQNRRYKNNYCGFKAQARIDSNTLVIPKGQLRFQSAEIHR